LPASGARTAEATPAAVAVVDAAAASPSLATLALIRNVYHLLDPFPSFKHSSPSVRPVKPLPSLSGTTNHRSSPARTAAELVPIAGYYGRLMHAQGNPAPRRAWGIEPAACELPRIGLLGTSVNNASSGARRLPDRHHTIWTQPHRTRGARINELPWRKGG
jgi:hypothetical protein